jgi:hypothetical protein
MNFSEFGNKSYLPNIIIIIIIIIITGAHGSVLVKPLYYKPEDTGLENR